MQSGCAEMSVEADRLFELNAFEIVIPSWQGKEIGETFQRFTRCRDEAVIIHHDQLMREGIVKRLVERMPAKAERPPPWT